MFKRGSFRRAAILTLGIVAASGAGAVSLKDLAAQQVIVQTSDLTSIGDIVQTLKDHGFKAKVVDSVPTRPVYLLLIGKSRTAQQAVTYLEQHDVQGLEFAEVNQLVSSDPWLHPGGTKAKENSVLAIGEGVVSCGDVTKCEPVEVARLLRLENLKTRGAGVRVAVLDTGTDLDHPDFVADKVSFVAQMDFLDGGDVTEGGLPIGDGHEADFGKSSVGHGTHVTGIVHRVAPDAQLMVGRILNPAGVGTTWLTGKGIFWAIDPTWTGLAGTGAHVINLSLDTKFDTQILRLAANVVTCANVPNHAIWTSDAARCYGGENLAAVVSAAAGNDGSHTLKMYPAAYRNIPGLIGVAASDNQPGKERALADFTNWETYVDIAAPGYGIFSQFFDDSHATISGTSMAAPMVSGLAALVRSIGGFPNDWTPPKVVQRIKSRAVPMCGLPTVAFKHIDVAATVDEAKTLGECPP